MLLILSNTPISKHYFLCLNPCLDTPVNNFYVKIHVIKHEKDPNGYLGSSRKTPPVLRKKSRWSWLQKGPWKEILEKHLIAYKGKVFAISYCIQLVFQSIFQRREETKKHSFLKYSFHTVKKIWVSESIDFIEKNPFQSLVSIK